MLDPLDYLLYFLAGASSVLVSLATTYQARVVGKLFDALGTSQHLLPVYQLLGCFGVSFRVEYLSFD